MRYCKLLLLYVLCATTFSANINNASAQRRSQKTELFFERIGEEKNSIIVFVHGFRGHGRYTWFNEESARFWMDLISRDPKFDGSDIASFFYATGTKAKEHAVEDIALHASELLKDNQIRSYKRVVFIAHSLGGLVVKTLLLGDQRFVSERDVDIHLFGVPTTGKELTNIQKAALPYINDDADAKHAQQLLMGSSDVLFGFINNFWSAAAKKVRVFCYFEGKKTIIKRGTVTLYDDFVVPKNSANRDCSGDGETNRSNLPNSDHFQMVRPKDERSLIYTKFRDNFLRQRRPRGSEQSRESTVYLDVYPDINARRSIFRLDPEAIEVAPGGHKIRHGAYAIKVVTGNRDIYEYFEVKGAEVQKIITSRPYELGGKYQICVFGNIPNTRIDIKQISGNNEEDVTFFLKAEQNYRCASTRPLQSGTYQLTASRDEGGFRPETRTVVIGGNKASQAVRFNLQRK